MLRLILFFILLVVIVSLIYTKHEYFTKKIKWIVGLVFSLIIGTSIIYQFDFDGKEQKNRDIVNAFNLGEILVCDKYEIRKNKFRYNGGTMVFLSNEEALKGLAIPVDSCVIKKIEKE